MSLYTEEEVHSDNGVELSMEENVVKMVEELVNIENRPPLINIQCLIGHQEYQSWTT